MLEMKVWSSRIFCHQKTTKLGVSVSLTLIKPNGGSVCHVICLPIFQKIVFQIYVT